MTCMCVTSCFEVSQKDISFCLKSVIGWRFRILQRALSVSGVPSLVHNMWGYVDTTIR